MASAAPEAAEREPVVENMLSQLFKGVAERLSSHQIPRIAEHLGKTYRGPIGGDGLRTVGRGEGSVDVSAAEQVRYATKSMGPAGRGGGEQSDPSGLPADSPVVSDETSLPLGDVENALTNLATGSVDRLRAFGPGSGFSGVYHPGTGKMLAYPSGDTRRRDFPGEPTNLVSRTAGHLLVEDKLLTAVGGRHGESVGFSAVLTADGSLGCRWTSRSVNGENPSFDGVYVPERLRPEIMRVLREITGRRVESDT